MLLGWTLRKLQDSAVLCVAHSREIHAIVNLAFVLREPNSDVQVRNDMQE